MHFDVILHDFGNPSGSLISVYEWSLEHVKMRNFLSLFEAFLTPQKSSSNHCFADFLKNKNKTWSRKSDPFWGHLYMDIAFFEFFTRPRKKHDMRGNWWVSYINLRGPGHTQKWAKSEASLSVGGFGGVRNVHRIRASGDVLFFHIVKYLLYDT